MQHGPAILIRARRALALALLAALGLVVTGCIKTELPIPFLPPSKYVDVGGRKLTKDEVRYYEEIRALSMHLKGVPNDAVGYLTLGELFQKKGHYDLARELYIKASELDKTLSEAHHNLGLISIYEKNWKDALTFLKRAQDLSPYDAKIHHRFGQAYDGMDHVAEAIKSFDKAIELDPEYTPAYLSKARTLYRQRRYPESEAVCLAAIKNLPKVVTPEVAGDNRSQILKTIWPSGHPDDLPDTAREEAHFNLALTRKAQGRHAEALAALVPIETSTACRADVQLLKSRLQEAAGDRAGATATLEMLRAELPHMANIPRRLARLHEQAGKNDLARQARLDAAELDHSDRSLQLEALEAAAQSAQQTKDNSRLIALYERLIRINPADLESLKALAEAYDRAGIARQAALTYQEVVNRAPEDRAALRRLGVLYSDLPGFQGRAVLQFKKLLEQTPNDQEIHRRMGALALERRDTAAAEKHLDTALQLDPNDALAHKLRGDLYVAQRRGEDAVAEFEKALQLAPDQVEIKLGMARTMLGIDRREEAIPILEDYLKAKPDDLEARRVYADALRDLNRREEAVAQYEEIRKRRPRDINTAMELAKLATLLGQRSEAAGMYESILEKNPADREALRAAARVYDETSQPLRAMYCWQRLLRIKPGDHEALGKLAGAYRAIGDDAAAIETYEKLGHASAWRSVAYLRLKRNEPALAAGAYRKVIELNKADGPARAGLAAILQRSEKEADRDEAIKLYQELIQLDANDFKARTNLANLLVATNRFAEAQEQYEHVLRKDEKHLAAHVGLGVILRKRGKVNEAREHYEAALQTDPNSRQAHYNLGLLYDYYLKDAEKARTHYETFVKLGGDPKALPQPGGPEAVPEESAPAEPAPLSESESPKENGQPADPANRFPPAEPVELEKGEKTSQTK